MSHFWARFGLFFSLKYSLTPSSTTRIAPGWMLSLVCRQAVRALRREDEDETRPLTGILILSWAELSSKRATVSVILVEGGLCDPTRVYLTPLGSSPIRAILVHRTDCPIRPNWDLPSSTCVSRCSVAATMQMSEIGQALCPTQVNDLKFRF